MKIAMNKWIILLIMLPALLHLGGCEEEFAERRFDNDPDYMQIYDYIKIRPELSIYKEICDYSGFYSQLSTAGTYTVFAAADSAWQKLYKELDIKDYKEKAPEYWLMFMKYAALEKKINTNSFNGGRMTDATMLDDNYFLTIDVTSYTAIKLNNTAVIEENNIEMKNGYLNIINGMLLPPITPIYELLKDDGKYEIMISLFEEHGLKSYLTDSLITLFVEPDLLFQVIGEGDFDPRKLDAPDLVDWLKYHIFPKERHFISDLDKKRVGSLYEKDVTTFNVSGKGSMYINQKFRISSRVDRNALNGLIHEMHDMIQVVDHTPGTIVTNLYGGTNEKKGYVKNVFADAPAMVTENMFVNSFHQKTLINPQPPICQFSAAQNGDAYSINISDVTKGSYTVRLIYNDSRSSTLRLMYKNQTIRSGIDMGEKDGDFAEYTVLKYKECGNIDVTERGDIELKFIMEENGLLLMDRIDLIPNIQF